MPVEIRELHIKVKVGEDQPETNNQSGSQTDEEELVRKIVEQVLEALEQKAER